MTNPRFQFDASVTTLVISVCASAALVLAPPFGELSRLRAGGVAAAGFIAFASALYAIAGHATYRKYLDLSRGEGVVARWTVTSDEWQKFVCNEEQRGKPPRGVLHNFVQFKRINAEHGVEIVVARDGLIVGDDFHRLDLPDMIPPRPTLITCEPVVIEIKVEDAKPYRNTHDDRGVVNHVLRFPASSMELHLAFQLIEAFDTK